MSLGIREAAVRVPLHNWFGGPRVTLAVMPRVICVTLSIHVFRPLIPLSHYLVSQCSQAALRHMGHTITLWLGDCVSFSPHINAGQIVIHHMSHHLSNMLWFLILLQHCSYLCLPGYPCFPSTSKFQVKIAKETSVVPNLPFGIRGPAFVRDCSQKGRLKWHNGKTKLWNICPNNK